MSRLNPVSGPADRLLNRRSFLKFSVLAVLAGPRLAEGSGSNLLDGLNERSLSFENLHTGEKLKAVYWAEGQYVSESLSRINRILRDHRNNQTHDIDRRLLDLLCSLRLQLDTVSPYEIISGYRSPATNALLHSNSAGVAAHSLHMDGMAADIRVPGRKLADLRRMAVSMKAGGVGYYPASQFVHVDVGRVRTW